MRYNKKLSKKSTYDRLTKGGTTTNTGIVGAGASSASSTGSQTEQETPESLFKIYIYAKFLASNNISTDINTHMSKLKFLIIELHIIYMVL